MYLGFLMKRFQLLAEQRTSEISIYFAKLQACFASVSRNISRNSSKIQKLWLTSRYLAKFVDETFYFCFFVFRKTNLFAKQRKKRNGETFRETMKYFEAHTLIFFLSCCQSSVGACFLLFSLALLRSRTETFPYIKLSLLCSRAP